MDLSCASPPPASDPALAEWLEGASCGPHVKALAVRAAELCPGSVTRTFGTPGRRRNGSSPTTRKGG